MAVAGAAGARSRGVDSTAASLDALESGKQLAKKYECIVGISGKEDLVRLHMNKSCRASISMCPVLASDIAEVTAIILQVRTAVTTQMSITKVM